MRYESEISQLKNELQEAYQMITKEEKKRLLLEEEIRKLLVKNMTSMNVEALHLFQQINHAKNGEEISLPNPGQQVNDQSIASSMNLAESVSGQYEGNEASENNTAASMNRMNMSFTDSIASEPLSPKAAAFNVVPVDPTQRWNQFFRNYQQQQQPIKIPQAQTYEPSQRFSRSNGIAERKENSTPGDLLIENMNKLSEMYRNALPPSTKFANNTQPQPQQSLAPPLPPQQHIHNNPQFRVTNSRPNQSSRNVPAGNQALTTNSNLNNNSSRSSSAPRYLNPTRSNNSNSIAPPTSAQKSQRPPATFGHSTDRFK